MSGLQILPSSAFFLLFRKKACKYFEQGRGTCPFGSKCLYRHAYPDGRLAEPEKPRKQLSAEGTVRVRTQLPGRPPLTVLVAGEGGGERSQPPA